MTSSIGTAWIQIKPSLKGISKDIEEQLGAELDRSLNKNNSAFSKFSAHGVAALNRIGKFGFAALAATATASMVLIGKRIGSAVDRVDTLLNFPRVLKAMGATGEEAAASTDKLSKSLQGLPTALQDGASGVQRLVVAGLSVPKATDAFLALNNSLIASGAGAAQVDSAMLAFSQSLSRGKIEGNEWNSLLATMPAAFGALQKETGKSTQELRELFQSDPTGLIDRLIQLNETGGEAFDSLEEQARQATGGIGTAWSNLGNAIDRGWQALLTAFGDGDLEAGSQKLAKIITGVGSAIEGVMKSIGDWISDNGPLIENVIIPALKGVAVAIGLITAGFILMKLANPVGLIIAGITLLAGLIGVVVENWDVITKAVGDFFGRIGEWFQGVWNVIAGFFTGIVDFIKEWGLTILAVIFWPFSLALGLIFTHWDTIKAFFAGVWEGIVAVFSPAVEWFRGIWGGIVEIFSPVVSFFGDIFQKAWDGIKKIFSPVGGFFRGVWGTITDIFGKVGTSIADAIGGSVKGVVNSILGFAEKTINGFIKAINLAIDVINAIPGVKIPGLSELNIPRLATGGAIFGSGGPTSDQIPAMLSDGEYVIKAATARQIGYNNLDHLNSTGKLGGGFTMGDIIVNGYDKDPRELADEISKIIARQRARVVG